MALARNFDELGNLDLVRISSHPCTVVSAATSKSQPFDSLSVAFFPSLTHSHAVASPNILSIAYSSSGAQPAMLSQINPSAVVTLDCSTTTMTCSARPCQPRLLPRRTPPSPQDQPLHFSSLHHNPYQTHSPWCQLKMIATDHP